MKKNKFTLGWFFISLLMAFAVTACDDDDDDVVNVTFPEKQTIGGAASETKSLTFDAVADWTLTSSSTWCYFINEDAPAAQAAEGVKEYAISGKAGKQTVTIGISDEGQDYDHATVASITIRMNGQEAVLAEVTRNAAGRTFKLYKKGEGDAWVEVSAEEGIEAGYDNFIQYKAEANFRFAATNRPEWLSIEGGSIVGAANQAVLFGIKVIEGRPEISKYAQKGNLNFQDEDGKSVFTYAVDYKGMSPEAMSYEGPTQYNWVVSMDGQTFTQTSTGVSGNDEVKSVFNKFVEYQITALNDKFVPVYLEKVDGDFKTSIPDPAYPDEPLVDWMKITTYDNGKVRLTVKEGEAEREGYVLVFPEALYNKIAENPYDPDFGLFEGGGWDMETGQQIPREIRYEYTQKNLLMNFIQKDEKQSETEKPAFKVTYYDSNWSQQEATLTKLDPDFGCDLVYSMTYPDTSMGFQIDPLMKGPHQQAMGSGVEGEWIFQVFIGDNEFKNSESQSITCDDGKMLTVFFATDEPLKETLEIFIKDTLGMTIKVLKINPRK